MKSFLFAAILLFAVSVSATDMRIHRHDVPSSVGWYLVTVPADWSPISVSRYGIANISVWSIVDEEVSSVAPTYAGIAIVSLGGTVGDDWEFIGNVGGLQVFSTPAEGVVYGSIR